MIARLMKPLFSHRKSLGWTGLSRGFGGGVNRQQIEEVLRQKIELVYFDIADESAKHFEANDSHFSLIAVAPGFEGQSLIQR